MSTDTIRFATFYSLSQFEAMQLQWDSAPRDEAFGSPAYAAWVRSSVPHFDAFEQSVLHYMRAMRDAGRLSPIEHTQGRHHRLANAWNRWLDHAACPSSPKEDCQAQWDEEAVVQAIARTLRMSRLDHAGASEVADRYAAFVAEIDRGQYRAYQLSDAGRCRCSMTGQSIALDFVEGWKPRLGVHRFENRERYDFEPVTGPAPDPYVQVLKIPAPTGELLVADWFRLEVEGHSRFLSDVLDVGRPTHSLETAWDLAAMSLHYAQQGLMSVFVGNSCPAVLQRDDHLLIARESLEHERGFGPEGVSVGSITTDLWWASAVDKQVLIEICARKLGAAQATQLVEDFMANDTNHVVVRVAPGSVYAHRAVGLPDLGRFWCEDGDVSLRAIDEPFAVVANRPLRWTYQGPLQTDPDAPAEKAFERARG